MRNLKKVLALALAVVMLVGMMVVGAGAASYKDTASSDYSDAIEVVTAIEALKGNDGNFKPDGRLTRADATVMLARVVLGAENVGKLVGATGVYTDVSAKHYAAGAIAWATNEGIISGEGNGIFRPNGSLYGVHFAKMLLGAMGFRADVEGFNGNDYQNIILTAALVGLLEGLEDVELNGRITRAQAAQMAFNAIKLDTRASYSSELTAVNGQLTSVFVREMKDDQTLNDKYQVAKKVVAPTVNDIGYVCWTVKGVEVKATVSDPVAGIVLTGDHTSAAAITALTNGALKGVLYASIDENDPATPDDASDDTFINAVINGKTDATDLDTVAEIAALTGHGKTVELYTAKNNAGKTVVYAVEVSYESLVEIASVTYVKSTDTYTFNFAGGTIAPVTYVQNNAANNALYNQLVAMELEAGDLLVASTKWNSTANKYNVTAIAEPTVVTGVITETDSVAKTMTVGGVAYTENFDMAGTATLVESNLYLAADGTVLKVEAVTPDTPEADAGYIFVTENWTGTGRDGSKHFFAGYTLDGKYVEEIETVDTGLTLKKLYAYTVNEYGQYDFAASASVFEEVTGLTVANGKISGELADTAVEKFASENIVYTYILVDGTDVTVTVDTELAEIEDPYFLIVDTESTPHLVTNVVVMGEKYVEPEYDYEDGIVYVGAQLITANSTNKKLAADFVAVENETYSYNCEVYIDGVKTALWMDDATYEQGFYKYYLNAETGAYKLQAIGGTGVITLKTVNASASTVESYKDWYITVSDVVYVATDAELYCLTPNTAINTLKDAVEFDAEGTVALAFYGYVADGVNYVTAIYVTYTAD